MEKRYELMKKFACAIDENCNIENNIISFRPSLFRFRIGGVEVIVEVDEIVLEGEDAIFLNEKSPSGRVNALTVPLSSIAMWDIGYERIYTNCGIIDYLEVVENE